MKLFGTPGRPFARKVRIFLAEKRIAHEYIVQRGRDPGSLVPQFNPLAKVPTEGSHRCLRPMWGCKTPPQAQPRERDPRDAHCGRNV